MNFPKDDNLIVGLDRADDAGVYRISDDLALIQTVDFFTPIVDDPFWFGQIAAANALSDIYAMGGVPKTAMNLVAFPSAKMDLSILRSIIQGGMAKMTEAGVVLVGGHSVRDNELKYGLSVTGFVHPDRIVTKRNLKPGDQLLLTKPLGTGIVNTAAKAGVASSEVIAGVTQLMAALNRDAAEAMASFPVHACTDITGFGLLGHLSEMVAGSGCSVSVTWRRVPLIPEALEYARNGFVPGGAHNNRKFFEPGIRMSESIEPPVRDLLYDPQTSGGLLISLDKESAGALLEKLREKGMTDAAIVGEVFDGPKEELIVD